VASEAASGSSAQVPPERASRARQRQRLIDACISALHIHGPSHTTVEKVVALADMSPGIVRFYFESKAAMLVASLEFLAAEFAQRVLEPVARLKRTPVRALELLVELYLDPDIASPRKVSVWYSFWGEASSRQEYLDICGGKDEDFAALVRELMERMIADSEQRQLDADGIALGLMGVLEVLWQSIAFQSEANIDRAAAKQRTMAYLRSLFPRQFVRAAATEPAHADTAQLPAWAYTDSALFSAEREQLFRPAWQIAGHAAQLPRPGDFLTIDLATERALVLRDAAGVLRAFRNTCRHRPHALIGSRTGTLQGTVDCSVHGLRYGYDGGLREGQTPGDLMPLALEQHAGLIVLRASELAAPTFEPLPAWSGWHLLSALGPLEPKEFELAADWKLIVEQWLESALAQHPVGLLAELVHLPLLRLEALPATVEWRASLKADARGWTAGHYLRQAQGSDSPVWQRLFVPPNQLIEIRPDGALILQALPEAPGRCRLRRLDLRRLQARRSEQALIYLAGRLCRRWLGQDIELAGSIQSGLGTTRYEAQDGPIAPALAAFRRSIFMLAAGRAGDNALA